MAEDFYAKPENVKSYCIDYKNREGCYPPEYHIDGIMLD